MAAVSSVTPSSDVYTNSLLGDYKWASGTITYSFPVTAGTYGTPYGSGEPGDNFGALNTAQQNAARAAFALFASVGNLTFVEQSGGSAGSSTIRIASSDSPSTAWGYYPSTSAEGGDIWLNKSSGSYASPAKGNYAYATMIHEIGHALGLSHPHDHANSMPTDRDSIEYSIMSYRSYIGGSATSGYGNETWGFSQSLMMYDIAAIQALYGANYSYNASDTVYSWSPTTGEMSINGAGQGAAGANRIFQTIWDGGGVDTYSFASYTTSVTVDLEPGEWTTTATAQLARLHYDGSQLAEGNIANALLFNGDVRSLIEKAIGGSAGDTISGNAAANVLDGQGGNDNLSGKGGHDDLFGRAGSDTLTGGAGNDYIDGGDGADVAVYSAAFSNYQVYREGIYWVVKDLRGGTPDGIDYLINVETLNMGGTLIALSSLSSTIYGDNAANRLNGTSANDEIFGLGGDDDIYGKEGDDTLAGGAGNDFIDGGTGTDKVSYSGAAANYQVSLDGIYWVVKDLRGGSPDGTDYLVNIETLAFSDGDVAPAVGPISGDAGNNVLQGTSGNDTISGLGGNDDLYGKEGNDTLTGGAGGDYVDGGAGSDIAVFSGNAADYQVARNGIYWVVKDLRGGSPDGTDYLINVETLRFADSDVAPTASPIYGDGLANVLNGSADNDFIYGYAGDDDIYGKGGSDIVEGGAGNDYLDGGADNDFAAYSGNAANYHVYRDGIYWVIKDLRGGSPDGTDYLVNIENARFADGDTALAPPTSTIVGNGTANRLDGTTGDDFIFGYGGDDDLYGKGGNDTLIGGAGNDYLDGGLGSDAAAYSGLESDYQISQEGAYWVVKDLRGGSPDGTDYLIGVEALQFADGNTALAAPYVGPPEGPSIAAPHNPLHLAADWHL